MKNLFSKLALVLIVVVMVSLTGACGGSNPGGPSDIPTTPPTTEHVTITFTVFNQFGQVVQPDPDGSWSNVKDGKVQIDFTIPTGVTYRGTFTKWDSTGVVDNSTRVMIGLHGAPKGQNAIIVNITDSTGFTQQKVALINS